MTTAWSCQAGQDIEHRPQQRTMQRVWSRLIGAHGTRRAAQPHGGRGRSGPPRGARLQPLDRVAELEAARALVALPALDGVELERGPRAHQGGGGFGKPRERPSRGSSPATRGARRNAGGRAGGRGALDLSELSGDEVEPIQACQGRRAQRPPSCSHPQAPGASPHLHDRWRQGGCAHGPGRSERRKDVVPRKLAAMANASAAALMVKKRLAGRASGQRRRR